MKPSEYIYLPTIDGKILKDSQGKPRMYKSASSTFRHLQFIYQDYDHIQIYKIDDVVSKQDFESLVGQKGVRNEK